MKPSSPEPPAEPSAPPAPHKAAQSVTRPAPSPDALDLAVREELDGWEPLVSPLVNPILALAGRCSSYEDFLAGLPGVLKEQDAAPLARSLSFAMFDQRVKGGGNGRA